MPVWRRAACVGGAIAIASCFPDYGIGSDGGVDAGADSSVHADGAAADATTPDAGGDATTHDAGADATAPDAGADSATPDAPADAPVADEATSDAAPSEAAPTDAPVEDGPSPPPTGVPVLIADAGPVSTASGTAQQQHVVVVGGNYWLFYFGGDDAFVRTRWSPDFVHWNDGASLTLPMTSSGEGRNLAVAARRIAGVDVVHVATSLYQSPKRIVWDTRATVSGSTIAFGTPVKVHDLDTLDTWVDAASQAAPGSQGSNLCDPDGTGVAITDDGIVHVATAWVAIPNCCFCDSNFTQSNAPDLGTSWDSAAGFQSPMTHYTVSYTTHSRQLVPLTGGGLVAGWDLADQVPLPADVVWATDKGGAWTVEDASVDYFVFPYDPGLDAQNDWSFCRVDDTHVHAVRRSQIGIDAGDPDRVFQHYVFDGTGWSQGGVLPADEGTAGSGIVLLTNGSTLVAAAISDDAANSIRYSTWNGVVWSAWATAVGALDGGPRPRSFLASSGCGDPAHPVLLWTEGAAAPYAVVGMGAGSLFP